jgi:hypothetical protein
MVVWAEVVDKTCGSLVLYISQHEVKSNEFYLYMHAFDGQTVGHGSTATSFLVRARLPYSTKLKLQDANYSGARHCGAIGLRFPAAATYYSENLSESGYVSRLLDRTEKISLSLLGSYLKKIPTLETTSYPLRAKFGLCRSWSQVFRIKYTWRIQCGDDTRPPLSGAHNTYLSTRLCYPYAPLSLKMNQWQRGIEVFWTLCGHLKTRPMTLGRKFRSAGLNMPSKSALVHFTQTPHYLLRAGHYG